MDDTQGLPVKVQLATQPASIIRTLRASRRNVLSVLPQAATEKLFISGRTIKRWHMVMHTDGLRRVLLDNFDNYPKSDVTKAVLRPAIGDSVFVVDGADWRWQRRTLAPAFSKRNVHELARFATMAAGRLCTALQGAGQPVDLHKTLVRTTFDVITDVTFSGKADLDADEMHRNFDAYVDAVGKSTLFDLLRIPKWVPRPGGKILRASVGALHRTTDALIATRQTQPDQDGTDLMGLLLGARDPETGRSMTREELRHNLLTFIMAGHETTALTLCWALYLCGFDETVQARARDEARAALQGRIAAVEDLPALKYCRQIIEEALRLYPPASLVSRTAQHGDTLCGRRIQRGDTVILPIYAIHRHRAYWSDPDAFDPARFADRKAIRRFTYLPFMDGPRICIGASFAVDEAVIILASLLSQYNFAAVPGRGPVPSLSLTLRPRGGLWMDVTPL